MIHYIGRRILTAIPVFFGITLLVFFMINATSSTIADMAGAEGSSAGDRATLTAALELDKPLPVRYLNWLGDLLQGDLGQSYRSGESVTTLIGQRLVPSLILTGTGVLMAVVIALFLGVMSAWKPGSLWDRVVSNLALIGSATPGFFLALVLVYVFSVQLGWLPAAFTQNYGSGSIGELLYNLLLPATVICVSNMGELLKQTRSACLEVLHQDYVRTARAKGVQEWLVVLKHGLRTALIPVLTSILGHIPHIIGGSVVVEQMFGWPGMGSLMFSAIGSRDYTVIMGVTVVIGLAVLGTGLLLDVVYGLVDPRVSYEKQ